MKQSGMTFIELIIAISIISILGLYAWPEYRELKLNQNMTQSINRLSASLHFARNQSIIASQQVVVCPSQNFEACDDTTHWQSGWMVFKDLDFDRQYNQGDELLVVEQGMTPQLEARSTAGRRLIRFDSTGFSPGTNMSIRFCDERGFEEGKALIISNAGRPRVAQQISGC